MPEIEPKWRTLKNFPESNGSWEVLVVPFGYRSAGEDKVKKVINQSLPLNPVLVSTPQTDCRFVPPIHIAPDQISARIAKNSRTILLMTLAFWILGTAMSWIAGERELAITWGIVFAAVTLQSFSLYRTSSDPESLTERWQFYGWCTAHSAGYALTFFALMIFIGVVQLLAVNALGSLSAVLDQFGLLYSSLWRGEPWRALTAPFLHVNLAHWIVNTMVGTAAAAVAGAICGGRLVLIAVGPISILALGVTSLLSPLVDWGADGIVGISGGVSGIIGLLLAATGRYPRLFPKRMFQSLCLAMSVLLLVSPLFINLGGFGAHLAGLMMGVAVGVVVHPISRSFLEATSDNYPADTGNEEMGSE